MARPKKYTDEFINDLVMKFDEYIKNEEIPIIAEFCYLNDIERVLIYDREEFSTLRKKCIDKKEAQLEKKALKNEVNTAQAIFSLKQLGWRDRQENKITINTGDLSEEEISELLDE